MRLGDFAKAARRLTRSSTLRAAGLLLRRTHTTDGGGHLRISSQLCYPAVCSYPAIHRPKVPSPEGRQSQNNSVLSKRTQFADAWSILCHPITRAILARSVRQRAPLVLSHRREGPRDDLGTWNATVECSKT